MQKYLFYIALTITITLPLSAAWAGEDNITTASLSNSLPLETELKVQQPFIPSSSSSARLYGGGGYFHPFVSVAAIYSDNIYNAPNNEQDDLTTVISPGFLLAYPGVQNVKGASFSTSNLTPGGLLANREAKEHFQRLQTSLLYHADLENYDDFSNAEKDHHRLEGLFQFNLRGGLQFDLAGEYKDSADDFSGTTLLDEYQSSLVDLQASFDLGRKAGLSFGAAAFQVDYEAVANDSRDREDSTFSTMFSYRFRPKTSLFVEYQYIDVDYDLNTFSDNEIHHASAGLKWHATSRSTAEVKVGYNNREYANPAMNSDRTLDFMIRAGHDFSPKTSLQLLAARRVTESTIAGTDFILNNQLSLAYRQKINRRFIIKLKGTYSQDQYENPITIGPITQEREDKTYILSPTLEFIAMDWLVVNLSYGLAERDSNFDSFDFTTNTYLIRITGYL